KSRCRRVEDSDCRDDEIDRSSVDPWIHPCRKTTDPIIKQGDFKARPTLLAQCFPRACWKTCSCKLATAFWDHKQKNGNSWKFGLLGHLGATGKGLTHEFFLHLLK